MMKEGDKTIMVQSDDPASPSSFECAWVRQLMDASQMGMALIGPDLRYRCVNRSYGELVGADASTIIGLTVAEVLGEDLYIRIKPTITEVLSGRAAHLEKWIDCPKYGRRYLRRIYTPNTLPNGVFDGYTTFIYDITDLRQIKDELAANEELRTAIINGTPDVIITIDTDSRIVEFNQAAERLFGYPREAILGLNMEEVLIRPTRLGRHREGMQHYLKTGEQAMLDRRVETVIRHANGEDITVDLMITETNTTGRRLFTASLRDISERKCMESKLNDLAYYDQETGLANRQNLLRSLNERMKTDGKATLLSIDIDRFFNLRNSFGHEFASSMLAELAALLTDHFANNAQLARINDHVLGLLLNDEPDKATLKAHVESILAQSRQTHSTTGSLMPLSVSIGMASATEESTAEELLRDSKIAAYHARKLGGNRGVQFKPVMRERIAWQTRIEQDLRDALEERSGLWLAYQPIVDLTNGGRLRAFEALLRWNHPEYGNIPPADFIPVAESTGLIVMLDRWVLNEACRQATVWRDIDTSGHPPLFMCVNLSPIELAEPDFLDSVERTIAETGINPYQLKLEVTEGAVMAHPERGIEMLNALKKIGVRLAIDDFGTGYSSLSYLEKLPVNSLKVDRSFVQNLHQSSKSAAILRLIIEAAHACGFDVIAEGVETEDIAQHLTKLSCDLAQGYHFARPLTPEAASVLVRESANRQADLVA